LTDLGCNGQATAVALQKDRTTRWPDLVAEMRAHAPRALARMYSPAEKAFVFRVRRDNDRVVQEGMSLRYTAITLIGLAREDERVCSAALCGDTRQAVLERLRAETPGMKSLGDVALVLWAAHANGIADRSWAWSKLLEFQADRRDYPTVEVAWALSALCLDEEAKVGDLREKLAARLMKSFHPAAGIFPHIVGSTSRMHVACFADQVYPIHALSHYFRISRDVNAKAAAERCAKQICALQGSAGQWWWHYDCRTGGVVEGYPVYAIHQDAMAPMALFALRDCTGTDLREAIDKGLSWLVQAPELNGSTLFDRKADLIWRKVARREPRKFVRYAQAFASSIHPRFRFPVDTLFPPDAIDYEDRPYHLGWLLYAWPAATETK